MKNILSVIILLIISGCNNESISKIKQQEYPNSNGYTNGKILDNRSVCEKIDWLENKEDNTVSYICRLKKGNRFFSFNDEYANNLRESSYKKYLEYKRKYDANVERNNIIQMEKSIEYDNALRDFKIKTAGLSIYDIERKKEEYYSRPISGLVYRAVIDAEKSNEGKSLFQKTKSISHQIPISLYEVNFNVYNSMNDFFSGRFDDVKYKHIYDEIISLPVSLCRSGEYIKNKNSLLKNKEWLNEIDVEHEEKIIKPICEKHLESSGVIKINSNYQSALERCLSDSYKPDYNKKAEEELRNKVIDNSCDNEKELIIDELKLVINEYNSLVLKSIENKIEEMMVINNQEMEKYNADLARLKSSSIVKEQEDFARKQAEQDVKRYAMTAVMYGEEVITWKYSKVLEKYILFQAILKQYEYSGETMSVNLDLNGLLASSINDVSNVDEYMSKRHSENVERLQRFIMSN
ncbi:hypothetical protein [Vibrio metschnikovii]|uniref:hypothetical protein n=1 Tax=Vibrio metschnikovii TaxID=28172 RepID=UPI00165D43CE|nr:hypothetical protein [Vibrio metschnikovii]